MQHHLSVVQLIFIKLALDTGTSHFWGGLGQKK